MMSKYLLWLCLFWAPTIAMAGGVRGTVRSSENEILPYATVFVRQTASGTSTNVSGVYEIKLAPGKYDLVFQYLGYEAVQKTVEVGEGFVEMDVQLKPQPVVLQEFVVKAKDEDPAYTIMRKAIAKAPWHRNLVDYYKKRVYVRGTGVLTDIPKIFEKKIKKESGIEEGKAFVTETVLEVEFRRPNTYKQKVLSTRSSGQQLADPSVYITSSSYDPEIGGIITPLNPNAMAYYKFEYMGSFQDRGHEINKIKVIPKVSGMGLFEGEIFIIEQLWSVHSVALKAFPNGLQTIISGIAAPIEENVWLPVTQTFKISGKILGFGGNYHYTASSSNYQLQLNKDLPPVVEVIDEKREKEVAKEVEAQAKAKAAKGADPKAMPEKNTADPEKMTRKQMRKMMDEYEKEELREEKKEDVVSDFTFIVDSLAQKRSALYWDSVRPIPLTEMEAVSYAKRDSAIAAEKERNAKDSIKTAKSQKFRPWHLVTGNTYYSKDKAKKRSLDFSNALFNINYNTVEGWNVYQRATFRQTFLPKRDTTNKDSTFRPMRVLTVSPYVRYAVDRNVWSGMGRTRYQYRMRREDGALTLEGGRYIAQYNEANPIAPFINTAYTLLFEENWMKIFEKEYGRLQWNHRLAKGLRLTASVEYANRYALNNLEDPFKWVNRNGVEYMPNTPPNFENADNPFASSAFPRYQALITNTQLTWVPGAKYEIRNGIKREITYGSPIFTVLHRKGMADVNYDLLEVGATDAFRIGVAGMFGYNVRAGAFLNREKMYLPDYRHFMGNQLLVVRDNSLNSFRLLDYYAYSTSDRFLEMHGTFAFRRFLVTNLPEARLVGIRESIFANNLMTPHSGAYTEVGYAIANVFRIFRFEALASFQNGQYRDFGFRIGFTGSVSFDDED